MLVVLPSIAGLPVQRNAASQASESMVGAVSDLLLASNHRSSRFVAGASQRMKSGRCLCLSSASAAHNCRHADWCRHHLHAVGKGSSQTPRFGVFGTCSLHLHTSEDVLLSAAGVAAVRQLNQ